MSSAFQFNSDVHLVRLIHICKLMFFNVYFLNQHACMHILYVLFISCFFLNIIEINLINSTSALLHFNNKDNIFATGCFSRHASQWSVNWMPQESHYLAKLRNSTKRQDNELKRQLKEQLTLSSKAENLFQIQFTLQALKCKYI